MVKIYRVMVMVTRVICKYQMCYLDVDIDEIWKMVVLVETVILIVATMVVVDSANWQGLCCFWLRYV